ncbi:MAG: DNA polymerase IV, partial [Betaproteobacteria bacterium]
LKRVPLDKRLRLLGVRASTLARRGEEPVLESRAGATAETRRRKPGTADGIDGVGGTAQLF